MLENFDIEPIGKNYKKIILIGAAFAAAAVISFIFF